MTTATVGTDQLLARLRTSPVVGRYFTAEGTLVVPAGGATEPPDPATPAPDPAPPAPPAEPTAIDPANLPEDHPLVKAYRLTKAELAEVKRRSDAATEQARLAALSDAERQVEEAKVAAKQAGRDEAATEFGSRIAAAEIKAALTGIVPDPGSIVEDLNISRYLTDTGEVDAAKVSELKAKYQALAKTPGAGSADGGPQGTPPPQKSIDDQIAEARAAGNTALAISLNNQKLAALAVPQ